MTKLILSISFCYHDSCITFADNDKVLLHLEAERYFKIKHKRINSIQEMDELIKVGLEYINKTIDDVTEVIVAKWMNVYDSEYAVILGRKFKYELSDHHYNHIGVVLPFDNIEKSVIYVSDGGSENGTTKVYFKDKDKIFLKEDLDYVDYTGKFYGTIAQLVIEPDFDKAHTSGVGKLMGLSSVGNYSLEFESLIKNNIKELNELNLNGVDKLRKIFNISDDYSTPWKDQRRKDLAKTAQTIWMEENIKYLKKYSSFSDTICMTGGCALNILLNSELINRKIYKKVLTSPICTDAGQSLGAIIFKYPKISVNYPFLGREFPTVNDFDIDDLVNDLLDNKIIAWYDGRSEIGARALGNRSFIGLPNSVEQRIRLSEKIKGREPYRPVAAIILKEDLQKYFYQDYDSPYMTFCSKAKEITKKACPAIVHFDGTTRIQTVDEKDNKKIYQLLKTLKNKNVPPIIMNTSYNVMGDPIVDTIEDAIETYKKSGVDLLYINGKKWGK